LGNAATIAFRPRKNFGKIEKILDIPNLIDMQKESYNRFLQKDVPPEERQDIGLQNVFRSVFPITDFSGTSSLEFVSYSFGEVKYDQEECLARGMTYEAPIKITVRLVVYDVNKETGAQSIRDIKEQEIYFGTLPLMTEKGTFIVNGTERVVVSQLHRSPGIFFDMDKSRTSSSGRVAYTSRIIPLRGSWIDFEFDPKEHLHVRIDRRRKFPVTILLKAIGYTEDQLLDSFYLVERFHLIGKTKLARDVVPDFLRGKEASVRIGGEGGETIVKAGRRITKKALKAMAEQGITQIGAKDEDLIGRISARDHADADGQVILPRNEDITADTLEKLREAKIREVDTLHIEGPHITPSIALTLRLDKVQGQEEAILDIYRKLRPSNPPTMDVARSFFNNLFFNPEHYDLSKVGRLKLNLRLDLEQELDHRTLTPEDIMAAVRHLVDLKDAEGPVDDIDHLGNRRVRAVGELLENQYRIGLVRVERAIKERMSLQETEALMPHDLVNSKPVSAVVKEFFGTSQLSQFMDQTNPLSEVTHKRRLSALGPGGLTRERAGFEVRDVHPTHYGRICPIETPEGPNIGLIVSLSTYARVNEFGFIETPYRTARDGRVFSDIHYLTALDEKDFAIAQANAPLDSSGNFTREVVNARREGEPVQVAPGEVAFMDVSPNQLVSVAASLIPFLENDDANRALMGSNMQRQAVPLLRTDAPLVGTGMESVVAEDSGVTIMAKGDGQVVSADADRIVIRYNPTEDASMGGVEIHKLTKYQRSNQNTCFNQKPIVRRGQNVKQGQVIADGPATDKGELALGRNVMVAFMSWGGYNFEDSILVSERVVKEDIYTSVHIEEFETVARDTKLGKEEITRDIPNLGEESLADLDEAGIVRIGAYVKPGDILVGKITPKGETQLSPEEKLLRAIFGEKAGDVKDTSLRVPPGVEGIVIDARVFSRRGIDKDERAKAIEDDEIGRLLKDQNDEISIIGQNAFDRLRELLEGRVLAASFRDESGKVVFNKNTKLTDEILRKIPIRRMNEVVVAKADDELMTAVEQVVDVYVSQVDMIKENFEAKIGRLKRGDELPPGVIKLVKVYVAMKRKLSVGDKMAGRHGNKGVVSRVVPVEDMPYFEDGTPVDVVLNPLGVPSRMNVGQVLETHLGWAAYGLGHKIGQVLEKTRDAVRIRQALSRIYGKADYAASFKDMADEDLIDVTEKLAADGVPMATPVFDGASEEEIRYLLKEAGLPEVGQARLFDGRTGLPFDQPVTVGMMYILKLHHLVDDKIHARSIGPYSLVTQQPLGGKAQFGGQRLGEMEVWAMEAYGAAYSLQEFLTVKSDDVVGRTRMYEKIVKGDNTLEADLPESFNVLIKELQSLGLDVELLEDAVEEG
jgi:DNA-directed RNA polymerase subunit beta